MVTDATGRPQDQGRSHRRRGKPSAETASLLTEYQAAMRDELRACLVELRGVKPARGLIDTDPDPVRPPLADRMRLWDLAIKVGRELGTEVDATPPTPPPASVPTGPRRRSKVDFG